MTNSFTTVQSILDTFVQTLGLPTVQLENERLKTTGKTSFIRTQVSPAITVQETIGLTGLDRLNGIYIIDMFYPKDKGIATPLADVDKVVLAFEAGTVLANGADNVEVWNSYPIAAFPNIDKFYQRQVIVEWNSYRNRVV